MINGVSTKNAYARTYKENIVKCAHACNMFIASAVMEVISQRLVSPERGYNKYNNRHHVQDCMHTRLKYYYF